MEKFRELLIELALSSRLPDYENLYYEGKKKRDLCAYYDGTYCNRYKVTGSNVPAVWISGEKMNPHPIFCFICPYFSIRWDEKVDPLDLFDILLYYEELKESVERELTFIDDKLNTSFLYPFSLKKRRDDLLALLNEINVKIKVIKEILKISR